jgi:carboxylesterase type B
MSNNLCKELMQRRTKIGLPFLRSPARVSCANGRSSVDEELGNIVARLGGNQRTDVVVPARWIAQNGGSAWEYQFEHPIPGMMATMHSSELPYVFGWAQLSRDTGPGIFPAKYTAQDEELSEHVQQYWTNFARTGDPNGPALPEWPKVAAGKSNLLRFTNQSIIISTSPRTTICGAFAAEIEDKLR